MAYSDGKLYIAPETASDIIVFDIASGKASTLSFDKSPLNTPGSEFIKINKFKGVFAYDDYVYFVGWSYPAIIKYSPKTGEMQYFRDYTKKIAAVDSAIIRLDKDALIENFVYDDEFIYAVSYRFHGFFRINLKTGQTEFISLGKEKIGFTAIEKKDDYVYLGGTVARSPIVVFDLKTRKIISEIPIPPSFEDPYNNAESLARISKLLISGDKLYVYPLSYLSLLEINLSDYAVKEIDNFSAQIQNSYLHIEISDGEIIYLNTGEKPTFYIIRENGEKEVLKFDINLSEMPVSVGKIGLSDFSVGQFEYFGLTLDVFIDSIKSGIYDDKTYFDKATEKYASYNAESSKRIIKNCKDYLKKLGLS
jgi:hypothetical protein